MQLPDGYTDVPAGKLAAVVTSLEMTARPALRPVPPGAWGVRRVERPDLDWYRDLFDRVGRASLWTTRLALADAALAAIVHDPDVWVHALVVDGRDEGLMELDFRQPEVCELQFFGVTPAMIGGGASRFLMNRAIETAWARPIGRFWLHTCTLDHPNALPFYQRTGFRAFRRQIEVFDDPRLTGAAPRDTAPAIPLIA